MADVNKNRFMTIPAKRSSNNPYCKWFETTSHVITWWSMIVRVSLVLRRTVCGDIDWRVNNLSGSYHQIQVHCESSVDVKSLVVVLIGPRTLDAVGRLSVKPWRISCEDCKTWLVRFDPSFVSQMSNGLLLVKLVGLCICRSCCCRQKVVCKVSCSCWKCSGLSWVICW